MKMTSAKVLGSVASSVLLVSAGAAVAAPALNATVGDDAVAYAAAADEVAATDAQNAVAVQGQFSYDQGKVTPTIEVASVFSKAAAALCVSLPDYVVPAASGPITIEGNTTMQATVSDMQSDDAAESVLMACACASNVAGGGAVANAEVSGVTLATVADMVGSL